MSEKGKKFYKVREVSILLRLNERTVYDAIYRGELPALRIGKQWRIPAWAVQMDTLKDIKEMKMKERAFANPQPAGEPVWEVIDSGGRGRDDIGYDILYKVTDGNDSFDISVNEDGSRIRCTCGAGIQDAEKKETWCLHVNATVEWCERQAEN